MQLHSHQPADLDTATADEVAELANAAHAVDSPHQADTTGERFRLAALHGWDGDATDRVLLLRDEQQHLVAFAQLDLPTWDNRNLAIVDITVAPHCRRQGLGSRLLQELVALVEAAGRTQLIAEAWHESAGATFLEHHKMSAGSIAAQRRLQPAGLPPHTALLAQARAASSDYDVLRLLGPTPDELVEPLVQVTDAINDAPLDDLELEDEAFSPERLRSYDRAQQAQHNRMYRVVASRRSDGALAGHSVVAVDALRPELGEQHDTTVVRAHRGHRLGLRLKLEMLDWLGEAEPQLQQVDTWNAESNTHMIAVNDAIGCVVVGRGVTYQKHL